VSSFYISCGWDEAGTNPTQTQLDSAIENLRAFPSIPRHNILIWQPHLDHGQSFINDWWDWVYDASDSVFDYESMKLANNLVIFCLAPSPAFQEEADTSPSLSCISRDKLLEMMVAGLPTFSPNNPSLSEWHNFNLADIFMSTHSMIDYMFRVNDMYPALVTDISDYPQSFHYHFGHLFNNVPVFPIFATSFYSQPKWTKHNPTDRTQVTDASNSLKYWKPYYLSSRQDPVGWSSQGNVPWLRHWDHSNRVPGAFLSESEIEANFQRGLGNGNLPQYVSYDTFDTTTDWATDTFGLTSPYNVNIRPDIDEWV